MKQRILTAVVALFLMLGLLSGMISCAKPNVPDTPDTPQDPEDPQTPEAPANEPPVVPDALRGSGETITIVTEGWASYAPLDVPDIAI